MLDGGCQNAAPDIRHPPSDIPLRRPDQPDRRAADSSSIWIGWTLSGADET
jgi:hypothetical protein